jgi:isoleucyl-tRNA synthetase
MFKDVDQSNNFPKLEESILRFWEERKVFAASISQREGREEFVFYDGPPFATGLPHFGHFVPGTIKDVVPRYKAMKGMKVVRRFGWDCHGLPVENLIEKELGLNSKTDIERFGIAEFNEACRASVLRYVDEWRKTVTRLGRWVDFDDDYKTMDPDYMESIWWVVKSLWDKGLVYEGAYILPYCPRCATVLSNHELAQGGYKDVHDPAISVRFKIVEGPAGAPELSGGDAYFIAWTTTPWTLPSNLALALGPEIDYSCVRDGDARYVLATARLSAYYKETDKLDILWTKKGRELEGAIYEPLFPYFSDLAATGAFRTRLAEFVTTEDGAGIVHVAPGFGEDDYEVMRHSGVTPVCPVDAECKFTEEVPDYRGRFVKDTDKDIIERLKREGKLVKRDQYLHAYPHCWRCDSPLIYRAVSSWFVKIEPIKQKMLAANQQVYWIPQHIRDGRFGKWLENARDWAISRSRYWGNPLPIWKCASCGKTVCVGSRDELERLSGERPDDLHKHFVDSIGWSCDCGGRYERIPEVLDCWFESGSMPYAQNHYPFKNKEHFDAHFPSDFIAEGIDQTRGWFYTLTVLAAALFDRPAFKACVVNGLMLASDGKKMSKSLRNYTDPAEVLDSFGADALRLLLMNSAITRAEDLCYSDDAVKDALKSVLLPLWSAYYFLVTYANADRVSPREAPVNAANPLDRWILSVCEGTVKAIDEALAAYEMQKAVAPIVDFIELLNNWYIRRSRPRFWRSGSDEDKLDAYATLYRVLKRLCQAAAPIVPFVTEAIWLNLRGDGERESVHLCDYPAYDGRFRDEGLESRMSLIRKAINMGRSLRTQYNLKNRQPLSAVHVVTKDESQREVLASMEDILREDLNVKRVVFRDDEEELVEYSVKANFRILGKELGKNMKEGAAAIANLSSAQARALAEGGEVSIEVAETSLKLDATKVEIVRNEKQNLKVVNEGTLTIALDPEITEALMDEGNVRDLIRGLNNMRKLAGLDVTDRIVVKVSGSPRLERAFNSFVEDVRRDTLAIDAAWIPSSDAMPGATELDSGDETWRAIIAKA